MRSFYSPTRETVPIFTRWSPTPSGFKLHLLEEAWQEVKAQWDFRQCAQHHHLSGEFILPTETDWGLGQQLHWIESNQPDWLAIGVDWPLIRTAHDPNRLGWNEQAASQLAGNLYLVLTGLSCAYVPPLLADNQQLPQLLILDNLGLHSAFNQCGMSAMITTAACQLLGQLGADPDQASHLRAYVREQMVSAYRCLTARSSSTASDEHYLNVFFGGSAGIVLVAAKDDTNLSGGGCHPSTDHGYTLGGHNVDNLLEQFVLLAGVIALENYLYQSISPAA